MNQNRPNHGCGVCNADESKRLRVCNAHHTTSLPVNCMGTPIQLTGESGWSIWTSDLQTPQPWLVHWAIATLTSGIRPGAPGLMPDVTSYYTLNISPHGASSWHGSPLNALAHVLADGCPLVGPDKSRAFTFYNATTLAAASGAAPHLPHARHADHADDATTPTTPQHRLEKHKTKSTNSYGHSSRRATTTTHTSRQDKRRSSQRQSDTREKNYIAAATASIVCQLLLVVGVLSGISFWWYAG